jgi:2-amino-4-hydroxy-6-hydroxymethyldihydropteridine diphosphokinase
MPVDAYVGLGANLGCAAQTLQQALDAMCLLPQTTLIARSSLFSSAPVDAQGDDFVNAVAHLQTGLDAEALLFALQAIELRFGRERPFRHAPRTLDLDLLLYGQLQTASAHLQVPHPRMTARAFVLKPLLELNAAITIPGKGLAADYLTNVMDQPIRQLSRWADEHQAK